MSGTFRKFLAPPVFDDVEKTRVSAMLHWITLGAWLVPLAMGMAYILAPQNRSLILPAGIVTVALIASVTILSRRGHTRIAVLTLITVLVGLGLFMNYGTAVEPLPAIIFCAWITVVGGLLLGSRGAMTIAIIFSAEQLLLAWLVQNGRIQPMAAPLTPFTNSIIFSIGYVLVAATFGIASNSIRVALDRARFSERELLASNRNLEELARDLEKRVQERTSELEERAAQLQTVSTVARTIAAVQDLESLLPEITRLVSKQFGFYHVGIFLLDDANEFAVLRAANSEGGARMLDRRHKLKLDTNSIVGYATSRGIPRIALDVGTDAVFFDNPDLPDTRSEMALPLRVGGRVIGALDVQSTEKNAFSQVDIGVLTTLADQVAVAIENARLFSEARRALSESQATFEKYVRQEWSSFTRQARQTGFVFDGKQVIPLENEGKQSPRSLPQTGSLSWDKASSTVSVPIRLRGQTIGVLDVRPRIGQREWTQAEITLLEAAAERAALALENARLVESAQRRAARERSIGDIAAKIGSVSDVDLILQTTVEELGRRIGGATEVTLELASEAK